MDLRNLCSKLDVDAIRAKIPPLPPLPQIKLPKSISKLKSRKIFRSSREDVNAISRRASSKRIPSAKLDSLSLPLGPPPSEFINRTPTRISTISSLMRKRGGESGEIAPKWRSSKVAEDENSYQNAGGIDDYYPSPLSQRFDPRLSRPISPVKAPPLAREFQVQSEQNIKMSLTEKLHKGYKDVSEFKLKHFFAKRTVVRKDNIEINEYVHRYDEDRRREQTIQEKLDQDIADNYRFQFKASKQNSQESYGNSPIDSPKNPEVTKPPRNLSELSGDESGMESSPPQRKPGIASTRFAKVRKTPLRMSLEQDNQNSENEDMENIELDEQEVSDTPQRKPNKSALYSIKKRSSPSKSTEKLQSPQKSKSFKERMGRLTKHKSEGDVSKAASEKKRKAPLSPQQSLDETKDQDESAQGKTEKPLVAIKSNFKRFQKSIKLPQSMHATADSENETNAENKGKFSKAQQFTERLKRFRSTDHVDKNLENDENNESPMHKITNKLQEWKKSFKKRPDTHNTDNDEDDEATSPQKRDKPVGSLMKKLKHIRSRRHESTDDPDEDEEGGDTYKEGLAARAKLQLEKGVVAASQMPQRTIKKISDTKKYFKKKSENDNRSKSERSKSDDEDDDAHPTTSKPPTKTIPRPPPPIPRPFYHYSSDEEGADTREQFIKKSIVEAKQIAVPSARTAWTTKPILSDDTTDYDDELPRVLIHQDNSDIFESTLIIAVTRPRSHTVTPIITEIPPDSAEESTPDTKPDNWIPNQDVAATYLEATPPSQRKLSKDSNASSSSKGHSRKQSVDSSSDDSWIKDIPRGPSIAVLNSVNENEEPWKIKKGNKEEKIYKTKSIDLFEMQKQHGGVLTAFEDFDDELKNTPVVKIEEQELKIVDIAKSKESNERESSEELNNPYDNNSSRVTTIAKIDVNDNEATKLKFKSYGNSQESLNANLDDNGEAIDSGSDRDDEDNYDEDDENDDDDDDEINQPPSKPPSPPPPPLPQRQPSIRLSKFSNVIQSSDEVTCPSEPPPPLPQTKPPLPPNRPALPPPPKIPDRSTTSVRTSKPLVKTASLRLAYDEQVNPEDIGKVNKLISRFEAERPKQRPRIIPRKPLVSNDSEDYSEEEEDDSMESAANTITSDTFRDLTPTNHPIMQKSLSVDSVQLSCNNNNNKELPIPERTNEQPRKATSQIILDNRGSNMSIPIISISTSCQDVNSNFSQPSSVYGSPLPYPSSLVGSTEVTPLTNRKEAEQFKTRRNRRSLVRDDENFYSFDSDEENSYYSISSNSSNRYVVEL
ncbi:hypothetical protein DOY81_000633 [Sarcophaga bullata]|nr:hypothetical protein DOY81_000633 [Sarcophaga bullata]